MQRRQISHSARQCGAQILRMFAQDEGEALRLFGGEIGGARRIGDQRVAPSGAQPDVPSDRHHRRFDAAIGEAQRGGQDCRGGG